MLYVLVARLPAHRRCFCTIAACSPPLPSKQLRQSRTDDRPYAHEPYKLDEMAQTLLAPLALELPIGIVQQACQNGRRDGRDAAYQREVAEDRTRLGNVVAGAVDARREPSRDVACAEPAGQRGKHVDQRCRVWIPMRSVSPSWLDCKMVTPDQRHEGD